MRHWRRHCPSLTTLELQDRNVVYGQGERCNHVYYVASGYIKSLVVDTDGREFIHTILHDGDFFGAVSEPPHQRAPATAVSKGPVRLYRCEASDFRGVIETQHDVARYLIDNLSSQLAFARRQTEVFLYDSVTTRVAFILREFTGRSGGRCRHGHEIDVRLTQQELAELVGASRPAVSTILNDMRRRGILSYTRTFICIESSLSLKQLLESR